MSSFPGDEGKKAVTGVVGEVLCITRVWPSVPVQSSQTTNVFGVRTKRVSRILLTVHYSTAVVRSIFLFLSLL